MATSKKSMREWNVATTKKGKYYYHYTYTDDGRRIAERVNAATYERATQVIVSPTGEINKRRLAALAKKSKSIAEKNELLARVADIARDVRAGVRSYEYGATARQLVTVAGRNRIEITLANMGLTAEEAAAQVGATVAEFLNIGNWNPKISGMPSSIFTNPRTGVSYEARWNYEGTTEFVKISA